MADGGMASGWRMARIPPPAMKKHDSCNLMEVDTREILRKLEIKRQGQFRATGCRTTPGLIYPQPGGPQEPLFRAGDVPTRWARRLRATSSSSGSTPLDECKQHGLSETLAGARTAPEGGLSKGRAVAPAELTRPTPDANNDLWVADLP